MLRASSVLRSCPFLLKLISKIPVDASLAKRALEDHLVGPRHAEVDGVAPVCEDRSECAASVAFTGRWTRVPSETAGVRFETAGVRFEALDVRAAFAFSRLGRGGWIETAESVPRGGRRCRGLR